MPRQFQVRASTTVRLPASCLCWIPSDDPRADSDTIASTGELFDHSTQPHRTFYGIIETLGVEAPTAESAQHSSSAGEDHIELDVTLKSASGDEDQSQSEDGGEISVSLTDSV